MVDQMKSSIYFEVCHTLLNLSIITHIKYMYTIHVPLNYNNVLLFSMRYSPSHRCLTFLSLAIPVRAYMRGVWSALPTRSPIAPVESQRDS